ncbi:hypothetical protein [Streptomyces vinaceus]|uniref:hypothetical protein n=1 Tax=Streptomyces vinaceus TaxID=1960 RepID=UPI00368C6F40
MGATGQNVLCGLEDGPSGSELAREGLFTAAMACQAGRIVGLVHRGSSVPAGGTPDPPDRFRPAADGWNPPVNRRAAASGAQRELYDAVRADAALMGALAALTGASRQAPRAPVHGGLRLDRFHLHASGLRLAGGTRLRSADPAQDIGAFVGEWLDRSLRAADGTGTGPAGAAAPAGEHEAERAYRCCAAFWNGYRATLDTDEGLAGRAVGYAGRHLLDRALAESGGRARPRVPDRAAVGLARRILLAPEAFGEALGLTAPGWEAVLLPAAGRYRAG